MEDKLKWLCTLGALCCSAVGAVAQTNYPFSWVNDPDCHNPNFGVVGANTSSPSFTNNAVQRGTLYIYSPIGATLALSRPGDKITFSGQVAISGDVNPDGDMQFRVGLFQRGTNSTDTNWLGYMVGNPAGSGTGAASGLYVRRNPNQSVFASGTSPNATRPDINLDKYDSGWKAGAYDFLLSVSLADDNAQQITWSLKGVSPSAYVYAGSSNNKDPLTAPAAFDHVGFMGGAALFRSASTANSIGFTNLTVEFSGK